MPDTTARANTRIRPAATLVLLRENGGELETLLLRRHSKSRVGSGAWVFPGGVLEQDDQAGDGDEAAARRGACRETGEEAGIAVSPDNLQLISHWTTPDAPEVSSKRFATWFFLSAEPVAEILVDGEEIDAYWWCTPAEAVRQHCAGELKMMPPTLVTMTELQNCGSIASAQAFYQSRDVPYIEPRMASAEDKICMLYCGDAGYETIDAQVEGPRNRCWLEDKYWRYEFSE